MTTRQPRRAAVDHRPATRPALGAQAQYERHLALARTKALAGDRIEAERHYQHAEHYLRLLNGAAA